MRGDFYCAKWGCKTNASQGPGAQHQQDLIHVTWEYTQSSFPGPLGTIKFIPKSKNADWVTPKISGLLFYDSLAQITGGSSL